METNFFTRQLTEYRVWPTGDKGCLFYVADARFGDEKSHGAVYIIDAPWREGDEVGAINMLHQTELRTLPGLRPVIKGFSAYLLTQDSCKWVEDRKILNKWWSAYCRWCDRCQTENINETEYIIEECLNWDMRTKEVMACYLYKPDMVYLYTDALRHVIRDVLMRYSAEVKMVMRRFHPYIRVNNLLPEQEGACNLQYDYLTNTLCAGGKTITKGIQAILIHYAAVRQILQQFYSAQDFDRSVKHLIKRLGNDPAHALSADELRMPRYDLTKSGKVYKFAVFLFKRRIEAKYKYDTAFAALSDQEQEYELVNELFEEEIAELKNDSVRSVLPSEEGATMRYLLSGYFTYLYKKLAGSAYAEEAHRKLIEAFPELEKKKASSASVVRSVPAKRAEAKKSPYFYETRTFSYNYRDASFDPNRRLALFYQSLCRAHEQEQTWIDPSTAPGDWLALFSGEMSDVVITWAESKQKLYCLFKRMKERKILSTPKGYGIWEIVENHFCDWHGNAYKNFNKEHLPEGSAYASVEGLIDILDPGKTDKEQLDELARRIGKSFGKR